MLRTLKLRLLGASRATGFNRRLANTDWRRTKLLILCYHGVSQDDEHQWNPELFMPPQVFKRRLELLHKGSYSVLSLTEGLARLADSSLPPRSVVLTFDDGMTNFRSQALPILREYGYSATVYLRTDYIDYGRPVYPPVCPYMLWKQRGRIVSANPQLGWMEPQDLRTHQGRALAWSRLRRFHQERQHTLDEDDAIVAELARHIGIDYLAFVDSRVMQIMSSEDVRAIAHEGVDIQLHTHSHQLITTLGTGEKLQSEIEENRSQILQLTGREPMHLCYPSGKFSLESLPALRRLGIMTATTCEPDLASASLDPLLLPRYVDTAVQTESEFEAWLSGAGSLLTRIRFSRNRYGN